MSGIERAARPPAIEDGQPATDLPCSQLDEALGADDIERLFEIMLGRPVGDDLYKRQMTDSGLSIGGMIDQLMRSAEFALRWRSPEPLLDGGTYRVPRQLSRTDMSPKRVLLIGSCALDPMHARLVDRETETEFVRLTFNNGSVLPPMDVEVARAIDFQLVQLPIRAVMPEHMYLNDQVREESAASWFSLSRQLLDVNFDAATAYTREHGIQTFVMNFLTPQQNPLGRLQDPYSLRNSVHYVDELNRLLYERVKANRNTFLIDAEQIAGTLGKRWIQDDSVVHLNHGSTLSDIALGADHERIEGVGHVPTLYAERVADFNHAVYDDALASYRSIRQIDAIKLVVFDLDDTLWRGVAAEQLEDLNYNMTEGWPLGILEAASYLMKRGILIAIVSKNDEANVLRIWQELYEHRFPITNFVAREINWEPKAVNIRRIIELANVFPDAVLFVDDNPAERAQVRDQIPGIRTLDAQLAEWRRVLLWSAELQPAVITDEAVSRSATISAKAERDEASRRLDPAAFLRQLSARVTPVTIEDTAAPRFARCLELINKTNQFNTNGQRWTEVDLAGLFARGGYLLALAVEDRYTSYGIVAIAICEGGVIRQYLMSCRVFGMEIERAAIALVLAEMARRDARDITAAIEDTGKNHLAHGLFAQMGFVPTGVPNEWRAQRDDPPRIPDAITVVDPVPQA